MAPVMLSALTSPEAGESLRKARLALIPTGSNEQHGPHIALRELREEMGVSVAHSSIFELAPDVIKDGAGPGDYGLACQAGTSHALHLVPEIVRRDKLPAPQPVGPRYRHPERCAPTPVHLPRDRGAFTERWAVCTPLPLPGGSSRCLA